MQDKKNKTESASELYARAERRDLLRAFRAREHRSGRRAAGGLCILFGIFTLAVLTLYVFLASSRTAGGQLLLPASFPIVLIASLLAYAALCLLILALTERAELRRFAVERHADATASSAIRLFKEEIDLPYVVTDEDGKIVVSNRAFDEAARAHGSVAGAHVRGVCIDAFDEIIRATAAESETDQKIGEIHNAAVRAYPAALRYSTTADTCLSLLREIDNATRVGNTPEGNLDPALRRVREIAGAAFREAESRSELWHLCLGTLENVISAKEDRVDGREKLDRIYELASEAYRRAMLKENELRKAGTLRAFTAALREIVSIASEDPSARQIAAACTLRLEMLEGRSLIHHTRTVLHNVRRQVIASLEGEGALEEAERTDPSIAALRAILRTTEDSLRAVAEKLDRRPQRNESPASAADAVDPPEDRSFSIGALEVILRIAKSVEDEPSRPLEIVRGIVDDALAAFDPARTPEYISLVTEEILAATTADPTEVSPSFDEIRRITEDVRKIASGEDRTDEEQFVVAFREAVRRISEESRLGTDRTPSDAETVKAASARAVSGALALLELRTAGVSALRGLIKYAEGTEAYRDLSKSDKRLLSLVTAKLRALEKELLAVTDPHPAVASELSFRVAHTLTDLLSSFDEAGDYSPLQNRADPVAEESDRSADARMRTLYGELSRVAATVFPITANQLLEQARSRISISLLGEPVYTSLVEPALEETAHLPVPQVTSDLLPEVSDAAYADTAWNASARLLLFSIGAMRVLSETRNGARSGTFAEALRTAEATFEKLTVRRILTDALVRIPASEVDALEHEGADDVLIYKKSLEYYRSSSVIRRGRILGRVLWETAARFLHSLGDASRLATSDTDRDALLALETEAASACDLLLDHATAARKNGDPIEVCTDLFGTCARALLPCDREVTPAGALRAALLYLSELYADLNAPLLRREFFRTYRDTAGSVVASLHRAEYTREALENVRKIAESILSPEEGKGFTFAGHSIEDCSSADLRTIAGLAKVDGIREVESLADSFANEALGAKALWELRLRTIERIRKRLQTARASALFAEKSLTRHAKRLKAVNDARTRLEAILASGDPEQFPECAAIRDEILALLEPIVLPHPAEPSEGRPSAPETPEAHFRARLEALRAPDAPWLRSLPSTSGTGTDAAELTAVRDAFALFLKQLTSFCRLSDLLFSEHRSIRTNKRRVKLLRMLIDKEEKVVPRSKRGLPLTRAIVRENFLEFLNSVSDHLRDVSGVSHSTQEEDPPLWKSLSGTIEHLRRRVREDEVSPYYRLYLGAALSVLGDHVAATFTDESFRAVLAPAVTFIRESAATVDEGAHLTREELSGIASHVFIELENRFHLGEIARDTRKSLQEFGAIDNPASNECNRIYHAVSDVRQRTTTMKAQSRSLTEGSADLLSRLESAFRSLEAAVPALDQNRCSTPAFLAMRTALEEVAAITAPFTVLSEQQTAEALRTELARTKRTVREVADATVTDGPREHAAAALIALGKSAEAHGNTAAAEEARLAVSRVSAVADGAGSPDAILATASEGAARVLARANSSLLRSRAETVHTDLAERFVFYRTVVTRPHDLLVKKYPDPTAAKIPEDAKLLYVLTSEEEEEFLTTLRVTLVCDALTAILSLTEAGATARIRAICNTLSGLVTELESDLRALPLGTTESFIPPALRVKEGQIRLWLTRLFTYAKEAHRENESAPDKQKDTDALVFRLYEGIARFDEIAASKKDGALNELPRHVRSLVDAACAMLDRHRRAEEFRANVRRHASAILTRLKNRSNQADPFSDSDFRSAGNVANAIRRMVEDYRRSSEECGDRYASDARTVDAIDALGERVAKVCSSDLSTYTGSLTARVAKLIAWALDPEARDDEDEGVNATYDADGHPSAKNDLALLIAKKREKADSSVVEGQEDSYYKHGLSVAQASASAGASVKLDGKRYRTRAYPYRSGGRDYYLITFSEVEDTLALKKSCEDENTVVALITLDNLAELAQYVRIDYREAEKEVEKVLRDWAASIHGIFHEYERDKYILFFSQKEMPALVNSRFSGILNQLENIRLGDSSVSVTVSMGISALGNTLTMKEQNASLALDLALKRGGALIAVHLDETRNDDRYDLFSGNRTKGLSKESRVGARVCADYLCELIRKSGNVLVMGHSFPDFDSIGSCVGVAALARYLKKDVHIVVNRRARNFVDCTSDLMDLPEYRSIFIDGTTGMELKGTDTLLVICDVSNTDIMESADIARSSFNTVIIDHHFKPTNSEELRTHLSYIDPSASSASELVAEILEASLPKNELRKEEANILLAGIMVDTKSFTRSVGARTFAAALYLRQMGANAEISSTYFYEQSGDYKAEVIFRRNLDFMESHREVAFTHCTFEDLSSDPDVAGCDLRVAASKAADKLLSVRGVRASFALYPYRAGDKIGVAISGRSDGSINVQEILELLGGGGHFDAAGASVMGKSVDQVKAVLLSVVEAYLAPDTNT